MAEYSVALDRQMELANYWLSKEGSELLREMHEEMGESLDFSHAWRSLFGPALTGGECFYWAASIMDIISVAAQSIPETWTMLPQSLLAPCGFFWFAKPIKEPDSQAMVRALTWIPMVRAEDGKDWIILVPPYDKLPLLTPGEDKIMVVFFLDDEEFELPLPAPVSSVALPIGFSLKQASKRLDGTPMRSPEVADFRLRLFASMLAFLQQRVLVPSRQWAVRSTRRRAEANGREDMSINVIKLRHAIQRPHKGDGLEVEWSCQWVVSGHWRDQWYPSIRRNQPIWIAPYIKGPEDKPLRDPGRLFAVVR